MKEFVGMFDSGVGGLSVLREVRRVLPSLDIIYFGDIENVPYGEKSPEEIIDLTKSAFLFLKEKGCIKVVSACNSVSTIVNGDLAESVGIPRENIIEMSIPIVWTAIKEDWQDIAILSTVVTKQSGLYSKKFIENGVVVDSFSLSGLVGLIEAGESDEAKREIIARELDGVERDKYKNVILACTHFPFVRDIFQEFFPQANIIDPAIFVAQEVKRKFGSLAEQGTGQTIFYTSKQSDVFEEMSKEI